jgi:serine/threonine protein kinase
VFSYVSDAVTPLVLDDLKYPEMPPRFTLLRRGVTVALAVLWLVKAIDDPGVDDTLTQANTIVGTPHYLAPEAISSPDDVGPPSDVSTSRDAASLVHGDSRSARIWGRPWPRDETSPVIGWISVRKSHPSC